VNQWSGQSRHDLNRTQPFEIVTDRNAKHSWGQFLLKDKVFIGLNTKTPTVVSVRKYADGKDLVEDLKATVVERTSDAVFLAWTNGANKAWLAAIDLNHRKAIVTNVAQGITSLVGELETLDCR